MARIPRILITGDPTVYHVISRTALEQIKNRDRQTLLDNPHELSYVYRSVLSSHQ